MNKYESGEKNLYKYDKEEFSSNKYEDKIPNKYEKEPEKPIYKYEDKQEKPPLYKYDKDPLINKDYENHNYGNYNYLPNINNNYNQISNAPNYDKNKYNF